MSNLSGSKREPIIPFTEKLDTFVGDVWMGTVHLAKVHRNAEMIQLNLFYCEPGDILLDYTSFLFMLTTARMWWLGEAN